jgi:ribosomal protein S12 methylthiotransferase accessory factor
LYSDQQYELPGFRYRRFDDEDLVRWVEGYSLTREKPVLVPALATYIPYTRDEKEHPYVQQITTGLACGNTLEEAILSGIGEVVERDATMMTWLGGLSRPRLSVDFAPNTLAGKTFARFGALRDKVVLIDISTDIGIPVVVAVSLAAHSAGPAAVFASKASLQPEQAVVGALDELAQCIVWVRGLMREESRPAPKEMTDVDSIEDHVLWPAFPENRHHHEFMWSSPDVRNCTDLPSLSEDNVTRDIHKAVSLLERVGMQASTLSELSFPTLNRSISDLIYIA